MYAFLQILMCFFIWLNCFDCTLYSLAFCQCASEDVSSGCQHNQMIFCIHNICAFFLHCGCGNALTGCKPHQIIFCIGHSCTSVSRSQFLHQWTTANLKMATVSRKQFWLLYWLLFIISSPTVKISKWVQIYWPKTILVVVLIIISDAEMWRDFASVWKQFSNTENLRKGSDMLAVSDFGRCTDYFDYFDYCDYFRPWNVKNLAGVWKQFSNTENLKMLAASDFGQNVVGSTNVGALPLLSKIGKVRHFFWPICSRECDIKNFENVTSQIFSSDAFLRRIFSK